MDKKIRGDAINMNPKKINHGPEEQLAMDVFKDLKPFTITINSGEDAMFLSMALMRQIAGSKELADESLHLMAKQSSMLGAEEAISVFCQQANEAGLKFPAFIKPLLTLMFSHIMENREKILDLLNQMKEKDQKND
jgi:hypothetical protein